MAINYVISFTFAPNTTISSSQVNTNFSDNANTWTNVDAGTTAWANVKTAVLTVTGAGTIAGAATLNGGLVVPAGQIAQIGSNGTALNEVSFTRSDVSWGLTSQTNFRIFAITSYNTDPVTNGNIIADFNTAGTLILTNTSGARGGIKGTTTNDSAAAGNVGESISQRHTGVSAGATNAWADLDSMSLTAGDWDVTVQSVYQFNTTVGASYFDIGVSTTTGNSSSGLVLGDTYVEQSTANTSASVNVSAMVANVRISIASTTTIYGKVRTNYSSGAPTFTGRISVRRIR